MRGWRKWSVAVLGIACVTALAILGKLDGAATTSISSMVGAFLAANWGVHRKGGSA